MPFRGNPIPYRPVISPFSDGSRTGFRHLVDVEGMRSSGTGERQEINERKPGEADPGSNKSPFNSSGALEQLPHASFEIFIKCLPRS